MLITNVFQSGAEQNDSAVARTFRLNNPGYDLQIIRGANGLPPARQEAVLFFCSGSGRTTIAGSGSSLFRSGDMALLRADQKLDSDSKFDGLLFTVPSKFDRSLPSFIRPDADPQIENRIGGCATQNNAYRRMLLTWDSNLGPYCCQSLNSHRVRISDSSTHYHPADGGFDEFYLIEQATTNSCLLTAASVKEIEDCNIVSQQQASKLLKRTRLNAGDVVYLPRGTVHRGLGGFLAQIIAVPGFVPGGEIGVDRQIQAINQRLKLSTSNTIPFNVNASATTGTN